MALSGSQKALMQARSGIARSGATRSGYYAPANVIITIDNGGVPVDVSRYVAYNGWRINLNLNDEVDTASVSLLPTCPFVPLTRSPIKIGFGAIGNLQFAGLVLTVQKTRKPGPDPRYWYDLTCIDWMAILDAHLVVAEYPTQSATTTILDIVSRFCTGSNISTAGVAANLPSVANMSIVNERPSTVLRRVTNKIGGGFWVDANRVLRAWSSTIPSPMQESPPVALTDHLSTLKTFRSTEDASQQRTRVWVEGQRTTTLLGVPALPYPQGPQVPVAEGQIIPPVDLQAHVDLRIGTQLFKTNDIFNPVLDTSNNVPGTILTEAAATGAPALYVADTSVFPAGGWCQVAGQTVAFAKASATTLLLNPSPQYGSLQAPVGAGAQVLLLPWITVDPQDRLSTSPDWKGLSRVGSRAQTEGTPVVLVVRPQDEAVASVLRNREGSDGFHEHLVQDGRYNQAGALARAQAELADFAQPTVTYEWETEDYNAEPGRIQHIAFTEGTPLTTDVRITNVEITPLASKHPPRRHVRATKIQTAGVVDIWVDDAR